MTCKLDAFCYLERTSALRDRLVRDILSNRVPAGSREAFFTQEALLWWDVDDDTRELLGAFSYDSIKRAIQLWEAHSFSDWGSPRKNVIERVAAGVKSALLEAEVES